jgi:hypothetical protein
MQELWGSVSAGWFADFPREIWPKQSIGEMPVYQKALSCLQNSLVATF